MPDDFCDCTCHTTGGVHIEACCAGRCDGCQRNIRFFRMSEHRRTCEAWCSWARRQKRAELKRLGLWEDFQAIR